jgi:hypothetical protein
MDNSVNTTLLALILAIKNLETPLKKEEEKSLSIAAQQFDLNPQAWDSIIEPELMTMIHRNQALADQFQTIKSKVDNLSTIPLNLIPTKEELDNVLPMVAAQAKQRPIPNINPQDLKKNNEITNMAIRLMSTSESSTTVKKLNSLEKLWQFLNQPLN